MVSGSGKSSRRFTGDASSVTLRNVQTELQADKSLVLSLLCVNV